MASGGGNRKKSDDSAGNLLGFLGGAVLGAALAYGVKKAYDYLSDEHDTRQREGAYAEQPSQPSTSAATTKKCCDEDYDDDDATPAAAAAAAADSYGPSTSSDLQAHEADEGCTLLHKFYHKYVKIDEADLSRARQVANHILLTLNRHINQTMSSEFPIGSMFINNANADLLVVKPDHFTVLVPIHLDAKMWEVVDGENAGESLVQRGYFLIRRNITESFPLGASPYDRHVLTECLSPVQMNLKLQETVECISWEKKFKVHPVMVADMASVVVEYANNKQVQVEFVPYISLGKQSFVSELHPKASSCHSYQNLWKRSFLEEEQEKIREIAKSEDYQMQCLQTFLALPYSSPAYFGLLKKDVLKTVFYHLVDSEDIWYEETLMERFIDMLKSLEEYLRVHRLPDYFNPYMDILEPYPHTALDNLRSYISKTIGQNQFRWLLVNPK